LNSVTAHDAAGRRPTFALAVAITFSPGHGLGPTRKAVWSGDRARLYFPGRISPQTV